MSNPVLKATVISTGETVLVYRLKNGNYNDYENMGASLPPTAIKAGKKEFEPKELKLEALKEQPT